MKIALDTTSSALAAETPLLALVVFEGDDGVAQALDGLGAAAARVAGIAAEEKFTGKAGKSLLVHTPDAAAGRIVLIGGGAADRFDADALRGVVAAATDEASGRKLAALTFVIPAGIDPARAVWAGTVGATLASYRYLAFRTKDAEPASCAAVTLAVADASEALRRRVTQAARACEGVVLARDLVNGPPNDVTPGRLVAAAEQLAAEEGLALTVLDTAQVEAQGMRLLMAVAAGSELGPRFIHLTYRPEGATDETPSIALVGKGITFDAGGYNIKPTGSMEDMKIDMAGAAAVLGAMKAVSAGAPDCVVHGIVPTCENLISGKAYKPGDVYAAKNGKTVEIMNTDAEGRLILADALSYAADLGVDRIVNLATLTGACMVALGPYTAAVFSNEDAFRDQLVEAAGAAGEDVWPMPLTKKLAKMLESPIADLKNIGERWGGAITAGIFLSEFVGETTWAHIDIAGPAYTEKPEPGVPRGGTGFGVLTLLELIGRQ